MKTENLFLNNCRHRDVVKKICKHNPYIFISKFFLAFLVKTVHLRNSSRLVVASGQVHPLRIADFQSHQKRDGLNGVVTSIDEISHEKIIGEGRVASDGEKFDEIVELSVDVSADGDGCTNRNGVGLLWEDGCSFFGDEFDLFFGDGFESAKVLDDSVDLEFITHF